MAPAFLVDIDCDLYSSTVDALRFVLEAGILVPGSYVYYDDVTLTNWLRPNQTEGEHRAHSEIAREWGLDWELLPRSSSARSWNRRPVLMLKACLRCPKARVVA